MNQEINIYRALREASLETPTFRYNSEILSDEEKSRLKSALYLSRTRPARYDLQFRQTAEGEVTFRRLVDKLTGEELLPWLITEYFGFLTYIPDEEILDGTVL